jgi:hypothetical protein
MFSVGRSVAGIRIPPREAMTFPRFLFLSELRTKKCLVVSDKALLFPTRPCRFRQSFAVSDKRLSFPTRLCRFLDILSQNV